MSIGPIGPKLLPGPFPLKPPTPKIDGLTAPPTTQPTPQIDGPGRAADSFSKLLNDAVGSIDKLQKTADANVAKLATGQPIDMHDVMISTEQASLGFQLGLQVRNKLIEAYQEVMRMQV